MSVGPIEVIVVEFPGNRFNGQINRYGLRAFLAEAQHVRTPPDGQAFDDAGALGREPIQ